MRKLIVVFIVVLASVLLPTARIHAQVDTGIGCEAGQVVEGRCLSVDDKATVCASVLCVEFVEDSVLVCPVGATNLETDPLNTPRCELSEPAVQRQAACPEGSRGEPGSCFIFVAIGPDGCPPPSTLQVSLNCARPVGDVPGVFYCAESNAMLQGANCVSIVDAIASPCPIGTTRFDNACWQLNGLASPEGCAGHQVPGTVELASGLCQVPLTIPTGSATCADGSEYREHPEYVLLSRTAFVGNGPIIAGCVDTSAPIGLGVASCFFVDDEFDWLDIGDGTACTRFEEPTQLACPPGFSLDDSLGGRCARFAQAVNGQCGADGRLNGSRCVFEAAFAEFDCPALTTPWQQTPLCFAERVWQGAARCSDQSSLLLPADTPAFGLNLGCFARTGPQPDRCNGEGTTDACSEVREPTAVECGQAAGCIALLPFVATCGDLPVTVDLNANPPELPTSGDDVILGTPGADIIEALGGDDVVCAGDGNDAVFGATGHDTIFGGSGNDRLFGAQGFDEIHGGDGDDTIHGNRGNDTLSGGPGADRIFGYAHDDSIFGGEGDDRLHGNFGSDTIDGGPGNDAVFGYGDEDTLNGGPGNDTVSGNRGNDVVNGGDGNDELWGADGDDQVNGGPGDDIVNGNSLNDTLRGGEGNDVLDGGIDSDSCDGGSGVDTSTRCEESIGFP